MKLILLLIFLQLSLQTSAQVAIGKDSVTNPSVSLEFAYTSGNTNQQKGILLPWVNSAIEVQNSGIVTGTLIFDTSDKKVKYYKDTNTTPTWFDLTVDTSGVVNTTEQNLLDEKTNAKVSIGTPTSTPGILVLEDTNKAMILPMVDTYSTIVNPSPGIMVYDLNNNMLCLFNGTVWSFWKP